VPNRAQAELGFKESGDAGQHPLAGPRDCTKAGAFWVKAPA